jgi:ubiquinone/menaquinone biosynthesis C-methylase UbiE
VVCTAESWNSANLQKAARLIDAIDIAGLSMSSVIYSGDRSERATATTFLEKRIEINRAYSSADFDAWLQERLSIRSGEDILDVGCGSGAQTIPFATLAGSTGGVSSLDISVDSIALLRSRIPPQLRVQAVAADMVDLADVIAKVFTTKRYSLVHSSYALYYSSKRMHVLDVMRAALKPGGRCAIFTPNAPHGLVELAARFTEVPTAVNESLRFGTEVLQPYFEKNFRRYDVHHFHNVVSVPSADILIEFYRQTTYYDPTAEEKMRVAADEEINCSGSYKYEKNGYLIIGVTDD